MESVEAIEVFSRTSARFRYRVPLIVLRELQYEGSRYSPQFEVGGWVWRFHIQERVVEETRYLALHLQSCTASPVSVHFKLSVVCMQDPLLSKSKTFHCTFKKAGSAWGLHQFIPMYVLLQPENGFIYTVEGTDTRCVDFEVTLQVQAGQETHGGAMNGTIAGQSYSMTNNNNLTSTAAFRSPERSVPRPTSAQQQRDGLLSLNSVPVVGRTTSPGWPAQDEDINNIVGRNALSVLPTSALDVNNNATLRQGRSMSLRSNVNLDNIVASNINNMAGMSPTNYAVPVDRTAASLGRRGGAAYVEAPVQRTARTSPRRTESPAGSLMPRGASAEPAVREEALRASLIYPFDQLEFLCDMSFDVQGVRVKAHRCVIGARMRPLLPESMLPLQPGCIVAIAVPLDVFTTFLRYVYTEDYPEVGALPAESLLDLYLLSAACEFYDLCTVCLRYVLPLLTPENILPIVLTRYNAADEVLTSLYLRVLLNNYDTLIQDKQFEEIPGHLFRRLSLILYRKESVPPAPIPQAKNTLAKQLAWLADSGEYSDYDLVVGPQQVTLRAHQYILACRSNIFAQTLLHREHRHSRQPVMMPDLTRSEYDFSLRCWQKFLHNMYRHHIHTLRDFSAEDMAIVFKMQSVLGMDGQLRREADEAFSAANALRMLIYAIKHQIPELHERAISYVANNFKDMIRSDPQAWELINELPHSAVLSLFRTVSDHMT